MPIILLTVDWLLNRILVELNQWFITFSWFTIYLIFNFIFTKVDGEPVYGVYGWTTTGDYVRAFVTIGATFPVYIGFWGLTLLKFKLLKDNSEIDGNEQPVKKGVKEDNSQ